MNIFTPNTYKRLEIIEPENVLFSESLLNYLTSLKPIKLIKPNFSTVDQKAPLVSLIESRFARYDSILNAVKKLQQKYTLDLHPHKIIIYGTNVNLDFINHVASIIRWWETIKSQPYHVTFYLTDAKKRLPPDNLNKIITEEYANSGFTFVRHPSDIHIFRKEEALKVLIHELIHASKFDFNGQHIIDVPCNLKDDDISNEGITEYLAIIHYYWYIASIQKDDTNMYFIELLSNDLGWQKYQISKILNYFDLDPEHLLEKNNFKQKTSIISYFFLKNFLFTHNSLPIILSRDVNKINGLIRNMKYYIKNYKVVPVLKNSVSLRMSLYELNC